MTETYPDILDMLQTHMPSNIDSCIIDSEIVAYEPATQRILPFQTLSNRSRKNVAMEDISIQVCIFLFDLLYLNGESLLQQPLSLRREKLKSYFQEVPGKLLFARSQDSEDIDEIEAFLNQSVKDGCEGLMVKTLDDRSSYEPAKRSFKWLKLKKDYLNTGLGDSLDLVPIGAFYGQGKRKGVYGSYLLACYNANLERFETCCKTGTGFSDEQLESFFQFF